MADNEDTEERAYFEDFLKATGWGLYYKFIVGLTCFCNFVQAVTFATLPLALAVSSCDKYFIPENIVLRIFTSFYVGSCLGGLCTNVLSDRYGRKKYLTYSLMFIFMSTFTAAFAYNPYVIIGAAFFLGVGLETNMVSLRLLMVEILPKEKRGFYMVLCSIFWASGYILTTVLTIMFETPTILDHERSSAPKLTPWRIMFAACGGANLFIACACALLEESPRYFFHVGRNYLAFLVLKQLYAINNSSFAENFKVKEDDLKNLVKTYDLAYVEPDAYWPILKRLYGRFNKSVKMMFSKRFVKITCVLILIKISVLVVGILQLNISLAKQLSINDWSSETKLRGLDFVYPLLYPDSYWSKSRSELSMCDNDRVNAIFYRHYLMLAGSIMPGLLICLMVIDKLGRKLILFSGLMLASCSFLTLTCFEHEIIRVLSSSLILTAIGAVMSTTSIVNVECFPTAIRGTANAVTSSFGLFLAVFFLNFIGVEYQSFNIIMAIFYFCLSVFTCFLQEFKGKPMVE